MPADAARIRGGPAAAPARRTDGAVAAPDHQPCRGDRRHGHPGAGGRGRADPRPPAGPVLDALRVRRRRGADLGERVPRTGPGGASHDPRRRRHDPGAVRSPSRRDGRRPRPVRGGLAGRRGRGVRRAGRRRRHRLRSVATCRPPGAGRTGAVRDGRRPRRCPHSCRRALPGGAGGVARPVPGSRSR